MYQQYLRKEPLNNIKLIKKNSKNGTAVEWTMASNFEVKILAHLIVNQQQK